VDSGMDALTHATEAFVSVYANDYTDGLCKQAIHLITDNIEKSKNGGADLDKAREKMHNAATIAGMAFANAFLGMVHAMSHTIGAQFGLIHGRTNAMFLPYVIRYNGQVPSKVTGWPKADKYVAPERYQELAKMLGLPAATEAEGVESYAQYCRDLATRLGIEKSFQEQGVDEQRYMSSLDALAMRAYEDQCAPANPRLPMLQDMKDIMVAAYYGISQDEVKKQREKGVAYLDMNPAKGSHHYHKDPTVPGHVLEAPIPEADDVPQAFTHKVDETSDEAEMIAAEHE